MKTNNTQSGSAIIWILIAVALFAALIYAFNSNNRTSVGFITGSQANAYADEIISYGSEVKSAVKRVSLRGCSDTEISFENNQIVGYTNLNAPASEACHVYRGQGGGLEFITANSAAIIAANDYGFVASNEISSIGSTCGAAGCSELVMFLSGINEQVCQNINDKLDIINLATTAPTDTTFTQAPQFIGVYSYVTTIADEAGGVSLDGVKSGCFRETGTGDNIYYNVLISR